MICATLAELPEPSASRVGWPWNDQKDPLPDVQPDGIPWPKISIVTPSYNQGEFIEETIRSVLLQGYPNREYIVVDGGSMDRTVSILQKYDPWIDSWVSESDRGQSHAINKGLEKASGEILSWLNSDDYLAPDALWHMADAFRRAGSEIGAIVGVGHKVNRAGEIVYTPDIPELSYEALLNWMGGGNFMQPACFFRHRAWKECGPLREDLKYPMDVDLWLKIAKEYDFERLDETIAYAYEHEGAKTTVERPQMRAETIKLILEHGGKEVAWRELDRMAEDLADARQKIEYLKGTSLYKYVLGPLYRAFWRGDR